MIAERVYRRLLRLYPVAFRDRYGRQMQILFRDLYRECQREHSLAAIFFFWHHIVTDLIANAWRERINSMKPQNMITPAIAGLFLLVPFVFMLSGLFGYSLGIEAASWPIEILYPDSASEGRDSLTDMIILLGPVVAVALLGLSLLRSGWDDRNTC